MARAPLDERNVRKLYKTGNEKTYAISIPIEYIRDFRWQDGQKLVITADKENNRLVIEDWEE